MGGHEAACDTQGGLLLLRDVTKCECLQYVSLCSMQSWLLGLKFLMPQVHWSSLVCVLETGKKKAKIPMSGPWSAGAEQCGGRQSGVGAGLCGLGHTGTGLCGLVHMPVGAAGLPGDAGVHRSHGVGPGHPWVPGEPGQG